MNSRDTIRFMNKRISIGELIKSLCVEGSGLSITEAARALKMTRENLSMLIHGKIGLSPEMAIKLEKVFGIDGNKLLEIQLKQRIESAKKKKLSLKRIGKGKIKVPKELI